MTPPNLQALFGARFRIGRDPAAQTCAEKREPWMQTLLCRNGVIYPHGANRLAVECKGATASRLMTLRGITVHQQGDTDWTLTFDPAAFDAVAAIVKPRKRRLQSEEQKVACAARLNPFRYKKRPQSAAHSPKNDERHIRAVQDGWLVVQTV